MFNHFFSVLLLIGIFAVGSSEVYAQEEETPRTKVKFAEMSHNFGKIKQGDKVEHVFKFENTGDVPLIINSAKGSCGCTVPDWPQDPIMPGETGEIKVAFNSKGKRNKQTKTVTINANTDPNPTRLTIKAEVLEEEKEEKEATAAPTALPVKPTKATPAKPAAVPPKPATTDDAGEMPRTKVEFEEKSFDFGELTEGDKAEHVFRFTNTGDEPLIINSAKGSCGCTVPDWPKEPIAPGEMGEIKVKFNSKGKRNKQTKTVTINANTDPNPTRLTIKANVLEAPKEENDK